MAMNRWLRTLVEIAVAGTLVACSTGEAAAPVPGAVPATSGGEEQTTSAVTYHEHVAPILQRRCQTCHVSGGIAPFALTTYEESSAASRSIVDMTGARLMPPWGAHDTPDCKVTRPWKDDIRLSDAEIDTLKKWHEAGAPEGDPAKAGAPQTPPPSTLPDASLTLKSDSGFAMSGTVDRLRCFVLDPKLDALTFVDAIHIEPEQRNVVHHVLVFVDPTGASGAKADANGQYDCFGGSGIDGTRLLTAWAPGGRPGVLPQGIVMPIEAGSKLVMQVHYHAAPGVSAPEDHTRLLLRFTNQTPQYLAFTQLIGNFRTSSGGPGVLLEPPFEIAPNAKDHVETMQVSIPAEIRGRSTSNLRLLGAAGHMHYVGVSEDIHVKRAASGEDECLLAIPKWDFDWQRGYQYDVPIDQLPKVTTNDTLTVRCKYDNTMSNPKMARALKESGQTTPQLVTMGESTLEEMCLGAFVFVLPL
jgi:hypothetical protein